MTPFTRLASAALGAMKRRLYGGGRPRAFMRMLNRCDAWHYTSGILVPRHAATLTVVGSHTGRLIFVPVVVTEYNGRCFLVSMLGSEANWVRNIRAAHGHAVLHRHGRHANVVLTEIPVEQRAPILRRYLDIAPGARPHIPVDRRAPLARFAAIAHRYPVFRID
jgi:hypothetical protein